MKHLYFFIFLTLFYFPLSINGQLEKVIVETYYISNEEDHTDTTGGRLDIGSTTYRIYVDLKPGNKLKKIYGDVNHELKISSTEVFYNHKTEGQSFAKDFIKGRYGESTVALDSWLTLGQTTKKQGITAHSGVLKTQDINGSFIGGLNNDGGSEPVSLGLLTNNSPSIGIPLITSDGMSIMSSIPNSWNDVGFKDFLTGNDSTIFGSFVPKTNFSSNNCSLENSGVLGTIGDSNQILIAQLTTKGELSFNLNIETEEIINGDTITVKYVSNNEILLPGEKYNPYLSYPFDCGCNDPDFLEYDSKYVCYLENSCLTPLVFGCNDTMACNYDPNVNFLVKNLCCYPGSCQDRDISIVCPSLGVDSFEFSIYPNPAENSLFLEGLNTLLFEVKYTIYDSYGLKILEKNIGNNNPVIFEEINISSFDKGLYLLRVESENNYVNKQFIKF